MEKTKPEEEKKSAKDIFKEMRKDNQYLNNAIGVGSFTGLCMFYIPYLRRLSDHIQNIWIKKAFRDFLNRLEDTMEDNGDKLKYKIKDGDYKYRR